MVRASAMSGETLSCYEILAPLGAGGMGEVFRARDRRLGREVAIKMLSAELALDEERLARLRREARALAALNHPNIATLYAFEETPQARFLVMELVPGETLAQRITRGPLPAAEALPLFAQLAEALDVAHSQSIVHRDLKPANLQITPRSHLKVLDFGLAKETTAELRSEEMSQTPTLTQTAAPTHLLGTVPYMSPEQARGLPVDKRTDIWAFGCCLYEALTGKRAFAGATASDTLAAILRSDPDLGALPRGTPTPVRQILLRCLKKEVRERQRDIGDVWLELRHLAAAPRRPRRAGPRLYLALVAVTLALLSLLFALSRPRIAAWLDPGSPSSPPASAAPAPDGGAPPGVAAPRELRVLDVSDLLYVLDADGNLEELELEKRAILLVAPEEPPDEGGRRRE